MRRKINESDLAAFRATGELDAAWYAAAYPDVAASGLDPAEHYLWIGAALGRRPRRDGAPPAPVAAPAAGAPAPVVPVPAGIDPQGWPQCPPVEQHRADICREIEGRLTDLPLPATHRDGPLISILTPVYNVPAIWLRQMVRSVLNQRYGNWQLCLVDDASTDPSVRDLLREVAALDSRIDVRFRDANGGISAATNDCLAMAKGAYVALLDNDDMITVDALDAMAEAIAANDMPDWLYSDEFKIDELNRVSDLFPKPDWSPLMLLNYMYTGHFTLYRRDRASALGGFRSQFDFSQDYDLALRMAELPGLRVVHVDRYLYAWRMIETSAAMGGKPTARISNIAALQDAVDRRGWGGVATPLATANRVQRPAIGNERVSIVVPSDNPANIATTIESISSHTDYANYEIVIVCRSSIVADIGGRFDAARVRWVAYDKPFNFSDKCNAGAEIATGGYVVFFNDDVRVITRDWIEALLEYLTLPGVGVVGPKLLYENGLIQHAGMATGMRRLVGTMFHCFPDRTSAHFNFAQCVREVSLICGALLAMPVELFRRLGGYDAVNAPIAHSDVDLCFRAREAGYTCVYTPYATLFHIGHASIGEEKKTPKPFKVDKSDVFLLRRWGGYVARDPYFPPPMRDILYLDSPEPFRVHVGDSGGAGRDVMILSHDLTASGAPKVAFDMAVRLKRQGLFVTVAAPEDGYYRRMLEARGITVVIDPLILTGHESSLVLVQSFDTVIANTILCWPTVGALRGKIPTYLYVHETELIHHFAETFPGFVDAIGSATEIWCGSARSAEAIRQHGLEPRIVEYGVADIAEEPCDPPVRISLFGSLEARKGQDLAVLGLGAVDPALRRTCRLTMYGRTLDHEFRAKVDTLTHDVPEAQFGAELGYDEYRDTLGRTDIVIVCSRDDTLPLVSLDALSFGKAIICSATTGTSEYLVDGESAIVLRKNSVEEIAQAYARLIGDPELRATLGRNARAVFERHFTYEAFDQRLFHRLSLEHAA